MDNDVVPESAPPPRHKRRIPATALIVAGLGVIVAIGAGVQGVAQIGEPVWVPSFTIDLDNAPSAMPGGEVTTGPTDDSGSSTSSAASLIVGQIILWTLIALVVLGMLHLLWKRLKRIERRRIVQVEAMSAEEYQAFDEAPEEPDEETMKRGLEYALDALDSGRAPNDAVEEAWVGLQDAAELSGVRRQPAETPAEFTHRMLRRLGADERAVNALLNLYLGVRFGGRSVQSQDVDTAREALAVLTDNWGKKQQPAGAGRAPNPLAGGRAPNPLAGGQLPPKEGE